MNEEERKEIIQFIYTKEFICNSLTFSRGDYTIHLDDKKLPIAIWKIKQRLLDKEDLYGYRTDTNFFDIITIIFPGGMIGKHKDPNGLDFTIHTRFNVFLQLPDTSNTFYGGDIVEAKERHYVMCRSGIDEHWSTINNSNIPRIALSYGFMLPMEKVLRLYKVPDENNFYLNVTISILLQLLYRVIFYLPTYSYYNFIGIRRKGAPAQFLSLLHGALRTRAPKPPLTA